MRIPIPQATETAGSLPPRIDLALYQGDDFFLIVRCTGVILTAYTAKSQIRSTPGGPDVLATFTATIPTADEVHLHLASVDATDLPAACAWDVQITDAAGVVTTLCYGNVAVTKEVTL